MDRFCTFWVEFVGRNFDACDAVSGVVKVSCFSAV